MRSTVSIQTFLSSLGKGALELVFFLPIFLIAAVYTLPASSAGWWAGSLLLCYAVPALLIGNKSSIRRIVSILLSGVIGFLHVTCFLIVSEGKLSVLPLLICGLLGTIFSLKGIAATLRGWNASFPTSHMAIGVGSYIVVQILRRAFDELSVYSTVYIVGGIASLMLFFLITNERLLNMETVDSGHSPSVIASKRNNRVMIAVLLLLMTLIALFKQIQEVIERFFGSVKDRFLQWLNRPNKEEPITGEKPADLNPNMDMFPPIEAKEPSIWMQILETIAKIFAVSVFVVVILVLAYFIAKKAYTLVKRLLAKLLERNESMRHQDGSYTDEVESLMTLTRMKNRMSGRLSDWMKKRRSVEAEWRRLTTNAERIRFLYAQLLQSVSTNGYETRGHLTPRETTEDIVTWNKSAYQPEQLTTFAEAYEQVRYGEKQLDTADVERFKQHLIESKKNVPK